MSCLLLFKELYDCDIKSSSQQYTLALFETFVKLNFGKNSA